MYDGKGVSVGNPDGRISIGSPGLRQYSDSELALKIYNGTGFIWLRTGTPCGLLSARQRNFCSYVTSGVP